jgi:hypothetical protein
MITFALVMITEATDARAKQAKKTEAEREACEIRRSPIAPRSRERCRVGSPPMRSRRSPRFGVSGQYRSAHHGRRLEGGGAGNLARHVSFGDLTV